MLCQIVPPHGNGKWHVPEAFLPLEGQHRPVGQAEAQVSAAKSRERLEEVACLVDLGYSQKEIAETYGFSRSRANKLVQQAVARGLCDGKGVVELRRGAGDLKGQMGEITMRVIQEAPALAEEGLTKTEAAKRLGVDRAKLNSVCRHHLGGIQWRDGRQKG